MNRTVWIVAACLWALAAPLRAAEAPVAETQPWEARAYVPEGAGLGLLEAVRITLEQDPNLLLLAEDVHGRRGFELELAGAFDWTMVGEASWEHREQELRQSVLRTERDKRTQVADIEALSCQLNDQLIERLGQLAQAQTQTGISITTDRGFEAQLRIIEAAILAANTPQQRADVEQTRQNLIATEIELVQEAQAEAAQGCREAGEALRRLGRVPRDEEFDIGRLQLRLEKLGRAGVIYRPFLRAAYDSTHYIGKQRGFFVPQEDPFGEPLISPSGIPLERLIDFGDKNLDSLYTFELGFEVDLPLGRGRGRLATGGPETAAGIEVEATELLYEHGAARSVLDTAFAYWNLRAAEEQVAVLEAAVGLQESLLGTVQALIEAEELPQAEKARTQAGVASARAQLGAARRDLTAAEMELIRAMGLTVEGVEAVPRTADPFPEAPERERLASADDLAALAVANRLDLRAARLLVDAGEVLAGVARTDLRPRLDVILGGWWVARGEGSASAALDRTASNPSWSVRAELEKPFGYRVFRGRLEQQEALLGRRAIGWDDLERQIRIAVVRTVDSLAEAAAELRYAEAAVEAAEKTLATEQEKLKLGETSVLDTVVTEQQRTAARLALVAAQRQVASLLAQLRFETGTLVESGEEGNRVDRGDLVSLPQESGS